MNKKLLIALFITLFLALPWPSEAFTYRTQLGITIRASSATVAQYNAHWATWDENPEVVLFPKRPGIFKFYKQYKGGPTWAAIDWNVIDEYFKLLSKKYGVAGNPSALVIEIMPINYSCVDESQFPYNYEYFQSGYGCIDGQYWDTNLIRIHLGDDSGMEWWGQLNRPFCATALDWELFHYFLKFKGDSCWWDEFNPACSAKYRPATEMCVEE